MNNVVSYENKADGTFWIKIEGIPDRATFEPLMEVIRETLHWSEK